jgi:hypothetical protein
MSTAMRILAFIAIAALGYASVFLVLVVGLQFDLVATLKDNQIPDFNTIYFGGGLMTCLVLTAIGIMNFFCKGMLSRILFGLPLVGTALYSIGTLAYFTL